MIPIQIHIFISWPWTQEHGERTLTQTFIEPTSIFVVILPDGKQGGIACGLLRRLPDPLFYIAEGYLLENNRQLSSLALMLLVLRWGVYLGE